MVDYGDLMEPLKLQCAAVLTVEGFSAVTVDEMNYCTQCHSQERFFVHCIAVGQIFTVSFECLMCIISFQFDVLQQL